jgi:hypothetical protein
MTSEQRATADRWLTRIAERWPKGWRLLAEFRSKARMSHAEIDDAARRAVEEMPNDVAAWRERAEYARFHRDQETEVACWVSIVEGVSATLS